MLSAERRLTRQEGVADTLKKGRKSGNFALVVSVLPGAHEAPARAGIIIGKRQISKATTRNRIKRRLRHIIQARVVTLPNGYTVVVRCLEGAVGMSSEELGRTFDRLLASALKKTAADEVAQGGSGR